MSQDARALYREGLQHFAGARLDEAIASYERALELNPDSDGTRTKLDELRTSGGTDRTKGAS